MTSIWDWSSINSTQPALPEEVTLNEEPECVVERETGSTETTTCTERSSQSPEEGENEGPENRRRSSRERQPPRWLNDYVQ